MILVTKDLKTIFTSNVSSNTISIIERAVPGVPEASAARGAPAWGTRRPSAGWPWQSASRRLWRSTA